MIRMVPRDASSAADAYLTPILRDYLDGLFQRFDDDLHNATVVEYLTSWDKEDGLLLGEFIFGISLPTRADGVFYRLDVGGRRIEVRWLIRACVRFCTKQPLQVLQYNLHRWTPIPLPSQQEGPAFPSATDCARQAPKAAELGPVCYRYVIRPYSPRYTLSMLEIPGKVVP